MKNGRFFAKWGFGLFFCGAFLAWSETSARAQSAQNDANNPLTPKITFNFHDYYDPSLFGLPDRDANQLLLRGLIPTELFGVPQLLRYTMPIATTPKIP
ncbi:MAG: hypothetical protein AB7H71_15845, partial [Alphaproteobacteria bacterium]